ncbi:MAG: hypothetical protein AABY32_01235 [Nanoarchaeota archaeon]
MKIDFIFKGNKVFPEDIDNKSIPLHDMVEYGVSKYTGAGGEQYVIALTKEFAEHYWSTGDSKEIYFDDTMRFYWR